MKAERNLFSYRNRIVDTRISNRKPIFLNLLIDRRKYRVGFLKGASISTLNRPLITRSESASISELNGLEVADLVGTRAKNPFQKDDCLAIPLHVFRTVS